MKQHTFLKTRRAFTLIETLIAVGVLLLSIVGPLALVQKSIKSSGTVRQQFSATYLLQDAMEYVKNARDVSILSSSSNFDNFTSTCANQTCWIDTTVSANFTSGNAYGVCNVAAGTCTVRGQTIPMSAGNNAPLLRQDSVTKRFGYDSTWTPTNYLRTIDVEPVPAGDPNPHTYRMVVHVSIIDPVTGQVTQDLASGQQHLFDFKQAEAPVQTCSITPSKTSAATNEVVSFDLAATGYTGKTARFGRSPSTQLQSVANITDPWSATWNATMPATAGSYTYYFTVTDAGVTTPSLCPSGTVVSATITVTTGGSTTGTPPCTASGTLIGDWELNETSGTVAGDSSTYCNDGTIVGGTHAAGHAGQGITLAGAGDNINLHSPAHLDNKKPITLMAWIKPTSLDTALNPFSSFGNTAAPRSAIFNKDGLPIPDGWTFFIGQNNRLIWWVDCDGQKLFRHSSNNAVTLGAWQHVAVTWDGTRSATGAKLYVNGVETSYTDSQDCVGALADDAANDITFGASLDGTLGQTDKKNYFFGSADELRAYSVVLTPAQIQTAMNGGAVGGTTTGGGTTAAPGGDTTTGLIAHFKLDEGAGTYSIPVDGTYNGITGIADQIGSWVTGNNGTGKAVQFNGTLTRINIPDSNNMDLTGSDRTIAMWIKPDTVAAGINAPLFAKRLYASVAGGYALRQDGARLQYQYAPCNNTQGCAAIDKYSNSNILTTGAWQHIAVVHSGTAVTFYRNGVQVGTSAVTNRPAANGAVVRMGRNEDIGGSTAADADEYDGTMDNIRLYQRALTAQDIQALYNGGI